MADVLTQSCDECGVLKKEANHWFKAYTTMAGCFIIWPASENPPAFARLESAKPGDLCSESCAVKAMCKAIGANHA